MMNNNTNIENKVLYTFSIIHNYVPDYNKQQLITNINTLHNQTLKDMFEYLTYKMLDSLLSFKSDTETIDDIDKTVIYKRFPHRSDVIQQYYDFYEGRRKFLLEILEELKKHNFENISVFYKKLPENLIEVECEKLNIHDAFEITITKQNEYINGISYFKKED